MIAYALAGNLRKNLAVEPVGINAGGEKIYLKDIWPTAEEINEQVRKYVTSESYRAAYSEVYSGNQRWNEIAVAETHTYNWDENSTYIANPPYFDDFIAGKTTAVELSKMKVLAKLGDSVTTDHISPAGNIALNSPAGAYLRKHGVAQKDFNSYGTRRGNHHVMIRGTLANTRLHNELAGGREGGFTRYLPTGEIMSIYDAGCLYRQNGTGLVILAGKDYGMGSSRDWAAKGVVRAHPPFQSGDDGCAAAGVSAESKRRIAWFDRRRGVYHPHARGPQGEGACTGDRRKAGWHKAFI